MRNAALLLLVAALVAWLLRPRRQPVPARWDEPADGLPPFDPHVTALVYVGQGWGHPRLGVAALAEPTDPMLFQRGRTVA